MLDVEKVLDQFVKSVNGELVRELLPKSPRFHNADYIFRTQPSEIVIAELKCLTKDLFKEGYQEKLDALIEDWINRRLISPLWGRFELRSRELPTQCQEELFEMLEIPIKRVVADANRQIKETKAHFGLKEAKGLLLLVNDGNYSLEFDALVFLIGRALGQERSGINSVVCFTVNMTVRVSGVSDKSLLWLPCHRDGIPRVYAGFLDSFRDEWIKFHARMIGERVSISVAEDNQLEEIRFVQLPEPRDYYKTRNRALVNLRSKISTQLGAIILSCRHFDAGQRQKAIEIAAAIRLVVHGVPNLQALIRDYFGREIRLKSTTMLRVSAGNPNFLGFLGLEINTVRFRAMLDDTERKALLLLGEWWEREPVMQLLNKENVTFTRKEIILAANGEELVSSETRVKYAELKAGLGLKAMGRTKTGEDVEVPFRDAHLAAIRQIAHELLRSDDVMALA